MALKVSRLNIETTPKLLDIIGQCQSRESSARVRSILYRYKMLVSENMPAMSRNEWEFIFASNASPLDTYDYRNPPITSARVRESGGESLAEWIDSLPLSTVLAMQDACVKFAQYERHISKDEALILSGAILL